MSSRIFYVIAITATVLVNSHISVGSEIPVPAFKTTAPENKRAVMENIYLFRSMWYEPPVLVIPIKNKNEASYDTPENAARSHTSAAMNLDHEWWFETLDRALQEKRRQYDRERNRTPDYWKRRWVKAFKNRQVFITSRIETGEYVIIGTQFWKKDESAKVESLYRTSPEIPIVLKKFGDKWFVTNDLQKDPVIRYWMSGKKKTVFEQIIRR